MRYSTKHANFGVGGAVPPLMSTSYICYDVFHCSINYCVELKLVDENKNLLSFHKEMISVLIPLGNVLFRGQLQIDAINSNFDNFESTLYLKSVSMPL